MRRFLLFILFVMVAAQIDAQKKENKYHSREIIAQVNDTLIRANILTGQIKGKILQNRTYFWYSKGIINSNVGGYSGKLLHGSYKVFVKKNLIESGQFITGLKSGKWITWYPSGRLLRICSYNQGIPDGRFITYKENGETILDGNYKNGKFDSQKTASESIARNLSAMHKNKKARNLSLADQDSSRTTEKSPKKKKESENIIKASDK